MSDPQDLNQFNQEELLKTKQIKTTTARSPRGSTVFEQGTKTRQLLKLGLKGKISVVQRSGQVSHPGLFGGLTHEVLQGLMKRQPLLH